MNRPLAAAAYWLGLAVLAYTFGGYALLMRRLARQRPSLAPPSSGSALPSVTAVVVAHDEAARITARLENLLAAEYPRDLLRVLLVSDGSTDDTAARASSMADPRLSVLARSERAGKAACLNAALETCRSDLVVFADARQLFAPDTITRLAAHFADPRIGAVSGALEIDPSLTALGAAVDTYWRMEKALRADEARFDSCIGCTGAVYAVRRALFVPIAPDTILDDVVIPMQIAVRGYRVLHDPTALAFDPQPLEPAAERLRKRRTLAGNFQMLARHPHWLLPWRNRLWWQLLSHKHLRLLAPLALAQILIANLALLTTAPIYRLAFLCQSAFYAFAAIGLFLPRWKSRLFSLPAGFVFLNLTTVRAFAHYLRSRDAHRWPRG